MIIKFHADLMYHFETVAISFFATLA